MNTPEPITTAPSRFAFIRSIGRGYDRTLTAIESGAKRVMATAFWQAYAPPLAIFATFLAIYLASGAAEPTQYLAHVYLAQAFLEGHFNLINPPGHYEMVHVAGQHYLVYGIGPTLLMLPGVAFWGVAFHQSAFGAGVGAVAVALWFCILRKLGFSGERRLWLLLAFGLGSLFWFYAGFAGRTWALMHTVTVLGFMIAINEVLGKQRGWIVGLGFGLAVLSRQPSFLALPFFVAMLWRDDRPSGGRSPWRKYLGFALGAGVLMGFNAYYNFARFGSPFDTGYTRFMLADGKADLGIFHPSFLKTNLPLYFLSVPPRIVDFPWFDSGQAGFNIFLSTPALALVLFANFRERINLFALQAALSILAVYQLYCWTGWTQFGCRYSVDMLPFAMLLIAAGARFLAMPLLIGFVLAGGIVEMWGIWWWHWKGW